MSSIKSTKLNAIRLGAWTAKKTSRLTAIVADALEAQSEKVRAAIAQGDELGAAYEALKDAQELVKLTGKAGVKASHLAEITGTSVDKAVSDAHDAAATALKLITAKVRALDEQFDAECSELEEDFLEDDEVELPQEEAVTTVP